MTPQAPPKNGLYYTPEEQGRIVDNIGKTGGGGGKNWYTDRVGEGVSIDPRTGQVKREGFAYWDQFNPFTQQDESTVRGLAEGKGKIRDARTIKETTRGVDLDELEKTTKGKPITADNVHSFVRTTERTVAGKPTVVQQAGIDSDKSTQSRLLEGQREGNQLTRESMVDARTSAANQMELMRLEFAQGNKDRLADRADARDARADELMMRREDMERLDRKDERNRRRDSIAALTAGLASLGAAFAL